MKMNQRFLIVFDLDGTLLDDEKHIMPKTKDYILKLKEEGHVIAMASGRPPRAILPYYRELSLTSPIISMNGALVYSPDSSSDFVRSDCYFTRESIQAFLSHFKKGEIVNAFAESEKNIYYSGHDEGFNQMFDSHGMNLVYGPLEETLKEDVYAFVFERKDGLEEKVNAIPLGSDDLFLRHWYDVKNVSEFGTTRMSKASGILKLQDYYHIDRIHTIAFGDAENDTEMLSHAGVPFAMKNGNERLKAIAHNVTEEDNCHEGIYLTLKKFFEF